VGSPTISVGWSFAASVSCVPLSSDLRLDIIQIIKIEKVETMI
jgi:hypothetical protein